MDLDQWITKVKDGQHLSEDELQLLCEYVSTSSSCVFHFFNFHGSAPVFQEIQESFNPGKNSGEGFHPNFLVLGVRVLP